MRKMGCIFVISGPSGCGKTTLCKKLLRKQQELFHSVSVTTRKQRKGEKKYIDYIYVTEREFKRKAGNKEFLEFAQLFGSYYGTPKKPIVEASEQGKDVILSIDVQGAAKIKKIFKDAVLIFILPPTFNDLKRRLLKRSADSIAQIRKRLNIAHNEMQAIKIYDYVVVNDDMNEAVENLQAIIRAERCRIGKERLKRFEFGRRGK